MTRNRTQTTLTALATQLANVNGELEFLAEVLQTRREHRHVLETRQRQLQGLREALYRTLKHFDPTLDPDSIGTAHHWLKPFGRKATGPTIRRYTMALTNTGECRA